MKNLSYGQVDNPPYIFSLDYDNIKKQNYIESNIGYKNVGYVAGQGEGIERMGFTVCGVEQGVAHPVI